GAETAELAAERDGIVDRAAAGIQHDGCTGELAIPGEFLELPRTIRCDDAHGRNPAPAIRLASIPLEMHRLLALFESAPGMRRVAQRRDRAGQRETKGGDAEERPAAKFQRPHKPQFGSFPQAPSGSDGNGPTSTRHDSVIEALSKR